MTVPREFQSRIASHNRQVVGAVLLCLLGSGVLWALAYALIVGITIGFLTSIHGEEVAAGTLLIVLPWWIRPAALSFAALLFLWGLIDRWFRRFRPVGDRQIIGWHILGDILLAAPRLTFGIWDHLRAMVRLNGQEQSEAIELLRYIYHQKRCSRSSMGAIFPETHRLPKILDSLQLLGWIGLLRHDEEWFYIIPSSEEPAVASLFQTEATQE